MKEINKIQVKHNIMPEGGFYETKFSYLPKIKRFLIGLRCHSDYNEKKLILFDIERNQIDTTDITYNSIYNFFTDECGITALNFKNNKTELLKISNEGKLVSRKIISDQYIRIEKKSKVTINDEVYYVREQPFSLYDKDFKCIYKSDFDIKSPFVYLGYGRFALRSIATEQNGNYNEVLRLIKLKRIYHFRKAGFIILGIELFLIFLYFFICSTLFIPLPDANKKYLTLFTIFGFIHLIKTHGNRHLFVFSKRFTKNKSELVEAIRQIDNTAKVISAKSFFLYKYEVYEISSHDEMLAIQIIAHDIKNNIANIKFLTERDTPGSDQNLKDTIKYALNNSVKLSNFTNLTKINYTKVNLEKLINKIKREFSLSASIDFDIRFTADDPELMIDEKKFEIVLRNLFQNSIDALSEDIESSERKIIVMLAETGQNLNLSVINKLNNELDPEKIIKLGFTTKKTGTGTGLYIVKRIIESMKGEMSVSTDNGLFTVKIKLIRNRA